jgi:hypothetical protein
MPIHVGDGVGGRPKEAGKELEEVGIVVASPVVVEVE